MSGDMLSPQKTIGGVTDLASDPQKMMSLFVGPSAAGVKPPPGKPGELKKPTGPAMTPASYGQLQERFSMAPAGGGGGGGMMDPDTMRMLAMLAGGGRA